MSFGGKRLKATGKRPAIPHHPRARLRRWLDRRTWGHVEMSLDGVPLQGVSEISFETKLERVQRVVTDALVEALGSNLRDKMHAFGRYMVRSLMGLCPECYAIPDGAGGFAVLRCDKPSGHDDWHQDANGTLWRADDDGGLTVRLPGKIEQVTTTVRVKP